MRAKEGAIYNDGRLRIDVFYQGNMAYVRMEGRFDAQKSDVVARAFSGIDGDVALELHDVSPISMALIMFLRGLKRRFGNRLRLVKPPPRLVELLGLSGASGEFETIDAASDAASAVRQGRLRFERAKELEKALTSAREIVRRFFPRLPPKLGSCQTSFVYLPCDMVGGDFFGFIPLPDERYAIFIGDVAGHGIEAAVLVGMVKKVIEIWANVLVDPVRVLVRANEDLRPDVPEGRFVTTIYGVLDTRSKVFQFARAGHNLPILIQSGGPPATINTRGIGLCIGDTKTFRKTLEPASVKLEPETVLFLHTDGLVEAQNPSSKEEFGVRRILDALAGAPKNAPGAVRTVMNALYSFRGGTVFNDDVTAIALSLPAPDNSGEPQ